MNLILFSEKDYIDKSQKVIRLSERHLRHIDQVLKLEVGDVLRVGEINSKIGMGKILDKTATYVDIEVKLAEDPPQPLNLSLVISLPRPKSLPRIVQTIVSLGVKNITFLNAYKVSKDFWSSDYLSEQSIRQASLLGLEQARDTVLPEIQFERRFRPYVEDQLPAMIKGKKALVAHPYAETRWPHQTKEPAVLFIGPEGGWIDFEIDLFKKTGVEAVSFGERILKLETAVVALSSFWIP